MWEDVKIQCVSKCVWAGGTGVSVAAYGVYRSSDVARGNVTNTGWGILNRKGKGRRKNPAEKAPPVPIRVRFISWSRYSTEHQRKIRREILRNEKCLSFITISLFRKRLSYRSSLPRKFSFSLEWTVVLEFVLPFLGKRLHSMSLCRVFENARDIIAISLFAGGKRFNERRVGVFTFWF